MHWNSISFPCCLGPVACVTTQVAHNPAITDGPAMPPRIIPPATQAYADSQRPWVRCDRRSIMIFRASRSLPLAPVFFDATNAMRRVRSRANFTRIAGCVVARFRSSPSCSPRRAMPRSRRSRSRRSNRRGARGQAADPTRARRPCLIRCDAASSGSALAPADAARGTPPKWTLTAARRAHPAGPINVDEGS